MHVGVIAGDRTRLLELLHCLAGSPMLQVIEPVYHFHHAIVGAVGFSTGTLNTSTTMVAQEIAGLPLFSGIGYRAFCLVVFSIVTNIYLIKYATRISKNPERSYMYDLDQASGEKYDLDTLESFGPMTTQKWLVLGVLVATSEPTELPHSFSSMPAPSPAR